MRNLCVHYSFGGRMWGSTRQEVSYYSVCQSIKPYPWLVDCHLATMQYGKCCVLLGLPSVYNDRLLSKQQIKFAWLKCLLFSCSIIRNNTAEYCVHLYCKIHMVAIVRLKIYEPLPFKHPVCIPAHSVNHMVCVW